MVGSWQASEGIGEDRPPRRLTDTRPSHPRWSPGTGREPHPGTIENGTSNRQSPWSNPFTSGQLNARLKTVAASTTRPRESGLARSSRVIRSTTRDSRSASAATPVSPARCNRRCTSRPTTGPGPAPPGSDASADPTAASPVTGIRRSPTLGRHRPSNPSGDAAASTAAGGASGPTVGGPTSENVCDRGGLSELARPDQRATSGSIVLNSTGGASLRRCNSR